MLGAPHLPTNPPTEADPQIDSPQVQQPTATSAQEPHIIMSAAPASDPVPAPPMPAKHSSPPGPTAPTGPNSSSLPMASIHITAQDFLAIMAVVLNFTVTSQSFVVAQDAMAERMACTKVVLAQNIPSLLRICHPCSGSATLGLSTYPSYSSSSSH